MLYAQLLQQLYKNIRGTHSFNYEAKVANESAWLFWLLGMLATLTLRKHACSFSAPNFWAALRLAISASYSASLLEARKPNLNDFSNFSLLGDIITIPTPDPLVLNTPFTKTCQRRTKTWHTPVETPWCWCEFGHKVCWYLALNGVPRFVSYVKRSESCSSLGYSPGKIRSLPEWL